MSKGKAIFIRRTIEKDYYTGIKAAPFRAFCQSTRIHSLEASRETIKKLATEGYLVDEVFMSDDEIELEYQAS